MTAGNGQLKLATSDLLKMASALVGQLVVIGGIGIGMWTRLAIVESKLDRLGAIESKVDRIGTLETRVDDHERRIGRIEE